MAVTIGELLVSMRASTASFAGDLSKAQQLAFNTAREMERSFQKIGTAVAAELSAATTAITASVVKSIEGADAMGKFAQKTGLTVEQFSGLAYAANLVNVPVDTLAKSLVILSKNLEKSNEQTLEGKAAHSALATLFRGNIPVFKDTNSAFEAIVARLAVLPEGFQRTALMAQIFGKAGAQLAPIILQNVDGIHKMVAEAQSFGRVLTDKTVKAATEFNETIKRLVSVFEGMSLQLAERLLPYLQQLADQFLSTSKNTAKSQETISTLVTSVQVLATAAATLISAFRVLGNAGAVLYAIFDILAPSGDTLANKLATVEAAVGGLADSLNSSGHMIGGIWTPAVKSASLSMDAMFKIAEKFAKTGLPPLATGTDTFKKSLDKMIEGVRESIATFGQSATQIEIYKLKAEAAAAGDSAWAESKIALLVQMQKEKALLDEFAALDTSSQASQKLRFAADQLKVDQDDLTVLKATADKLMVMANIPQPLVLSPQVNKAFTDANEELKTSLQHSIDVWGKSAHWVTLYNLALADSSPAARKVAEETALMVDKLQHIQDATTAWKEFGQVAGQSLSDLIFSGKKFVDVLKDTVKMLGEMFLKWSLFGIGGHGGLFATLGAAIGISGFAAGGSIGSGQPAIVGESGPELFIPAMSGRIIPNNAIGGGINITYQVDARGSSLTQEQIVRAMKVTEDRAVGRALSMANEISKRT